MAELMQSTAIDASPHAAAMPAFSPRHLNMLLLGLGFATGMEFYTADSINLGTENTNVWGQFGFDAFFLDTKDVATWAARVCTVVYFLFFFLMPWYTARDEVKPVPDRVTS